MNKDIKSDIPVKDLGKDEGSPMADKPLSPSAAENALEAVKAQSPRSTEDCHTPFRERERSLHTCAQDVQITRTVTI
jgi:hypothetical protein